LALWQAVQIEYGIQDRGGIEMLLVGCQALDRAERLRVQIDADGEVIRLRNGAVRAHPAIRDETGCRAQVMRALEKLGLNYEVVKAVGRPPGSFNR
jgi:hypothetical protein